MEHLWETQKDFQKEPMTGGHLGMQMDLKLGLMKEPHLGPSTDLYSVLHWENQKDLQKDLQKGHQKEPLKESH